MSGVPSQYFAYGALSPARRTPLARNVDGRHQQRQLHPVALYCQHPQTPPLNLKTMLAGLTRHSQSALRQTCRPALSPRTITTPRSFHTSPTAAAPPRKYNMPMVPSNLTKPPAKKPAQKVQEDEGWQQIFAPLVRKFLKSGDASGSRITSEEAEQVWKDKEKHFVSTLPKPPGPYAGKASSYKVSCHA